VAHLLLFIEARGLPRSFFPIIPPFRCASSLAPRAASTTRDLIWTMTLNFDRWFDITLLSIRTSGCRARIVVFTDDQHVYHPHFFRVLMMTEAEVHRRILPVGPYLNDFVRFQWIRGFLKEHTHEIDKLFMLDAFDIFFHRDPFEALFFNDTLVLIGEGWSLRRAGLNPGWLATCYGTNAKHVLDNETICAGTIFGPPAVFIAFVELLLAKWPQPHCLWDQPIVNYLLYSGEMKKAGIKVKALNCFGPVLTLARCPKRVARVGDVQEGFNGNDEIPHVVHQWKHFPLFLDMYVERCNMKEYMTKLQKMLKVDLNWSEPIRMT
jgi:hypothetical protein